MTDDPARAGRCTRECGHEGPHDAYNMWTDVLMPTPANPAGHRPTDDAVGPICVVCHENWPCAATPANPAGLRERIEALTRYKPRPFSDGGGMGPHADGGWLAISDVRAVLDAPVAVDGVFVTVEELAALMTPVSSTLPWSEENERAVKAAAVAINSKWLAARLPEPVPEWNDGLYQEERQP